MRHGIPIACGVTNGGMQTCNDGEAWPGLWEVPGGWRALVSLGCM